MIKDLKKRFGMDYVPNDLIEQFEMAWLLPNGMAIIVDDHDDAASYAGIKDEMGGPASDAAQRDLGWARKTSEGMYYSCSIRKTNAALKQIQDNARTIASTLDEIAGEDEFVVDVDSQTIKLSVAQGRKIDFDITKMKTIKSVVNGGMASSYKSECKILESEKVAGNDKIDRMGKIFEAVDKIYRGEEK